MTTMNNIYMLPTPTQARQDTSNAIHQIVIKLEQYLPQYGWQITEDRSEADLIAGHAGQTDGHTPVDIAHCHGLYPTQAHPAHQWHWAANAHVLDNLRTAYQVTVPSSWVADILRRDMHIDPAVIGWAIEHGDWAGAENQGYVLWNKTRADSTCDPTPLLELAKRFPQIRFVTTFGENAPANVTVIGRQPYEKMQQFVRGAAVYLATTKETFGIGTLEPMACGIPVLGYDWGATPELVDHGGTGYLVPPGDLDALAAGLEYCLQHRDTLGENARQAVQVYTWERVAADFADVYEAALAMRQRKADTPRVSVVIPCYNYARYLPDAIQSVLHQQTRFDIEIIVVDDQSTDDSHAVAQRLLANVPHARVIQTRENGGPARARNLGIALATGDYIVCLDADDQLRAGEPVLQTFAEALDQDRTLGIVYAGLLAIGENDMVIPAGGGWPGPFHFEDQIRGFNQVPTCCMFRKEAWRRAGGYKSRLEPAEDAELWLHMTALGYRARQVTDAQWFVYRYHSHSLSSAVRSGRQPEPKWLQPHLGWIKTDQRPMAAPVPPEGRHSNPVRNYDQPEISVIIPCGLGHERWLSEALDSVQAQTFWNWEAIVVFDHDYVMPEDKWSAYPWVRFFWTDGNKGAGATRNLGAKQARGKFLAFLDADDLLLPEFLEETRRAFRETGRYAYTDWVSISKTGQLETHECPNYDPETLFARQSIHAVSVLLPRADFEAVGGFAEDMGAWEDVELYMKLAAAGFCGVRVPKPLLVYRYSTGNMREYGETIKDELKDYLMRKYGAFIRGEAMCACEEMLNRELAVPALTEENPDVVRVRMDGPRAPAAPMPIKGASGQQYARRQRGDVFLILRRDLEGLKHMVSPFQEIDVVAPPVVIPPPPVPLVREGVAQ